MSEGLNKKHLRNTDWSGFCSKQEDAARGLVFWVFFSLVLLNLLVKISTFAMEIIVNILLKSLVNSGCPLEVLLVQTYKRDFAHLIWKGLTSEIGSFVIW